MAYEAEGRLAASLALLGLAQLQKNWIYLQELLDNAIMDHGRLFGGQGMGILSGGLTVTLVA